MLISERCKQAEMYLCSSNESLCGVGILRALHDHDENNLLPTTNLQKSGKSALWSRTYDSTKSTLNSAIRIAIGHHERRSVPRFSCCE